MSRSPAPGLNLNSPSTQSRVTSHWSVVGLNRFAVD